MTDEIIDRQSPERVPRRGCVTSIGIGVLAGIVVGLGLAVAMDELLWPIVAGVGLATVVALVLRFRTGRRGRGFRG